jgi:hypothetical protein
MYLRNIAITAEDIPPRMREVVVGAQEFFLLP